MNSKAKIISSDVQTINISDSFTEMQGENFTDQQIKAIEIKSKKECTGLEEYIVLEVFNEESIVVDFFPDISPKQADCFFKELSESCGKYSLHAYSKRLFVVFHDSDYIFSKIAFFTHVNQELKIPVNEIKSSNGIIEIQTTFDDCLNTYSEYLNY